MFISEYQRDYAILTVCASVCLSACVNRIIFKVVFDEIFCMDTSYYSNWDKEDASNIGCDADCNANPGHGTTRVSILPYQMAAICD